MFENELEISNEELEEILGLESIDGFIKTVGKGIGEVIIAIVKPIAKLVATNAKEGITKNQFSDFIGVFFKTGRFDKSMEISGIELTNEKRDELRRLLGKIDNIPGFVQKTMAVAAVSSLLYQFYKKYKSKKDKEKESSNEDIGSSFSSGSVVLNEDEIESKKTASTAVSLGVAIMNKLVDKSLIQISGNDELAVLITAGIQAELKL